MGRWAPEALRHLKALAFALVTVLAAAFLLLLAGACARDLSRILDRDAEFDKLIEVLIMES